MAPTTVRMVLVEGDKADGVTVDHDTFDITADDGAATNSAADQVIAAILGTRESAAEGGHHLISTGVTWTDHNAAAELRDALTAHRIDDVILVSELHAAGSLAQAVGRAVGYERTALLFLERDNATLSVVQTADGAVVKVQSRSLHAPDAVAELSTMVAGLEAIDEPPQGLFIVGAGIDVVALKSQIAAETDLPVHAPDEADLALARGAALASAAAPRYEASTVGLAYAQDRDGTTAGAVYAAGADTQMAAGATQMAAAGYMAPLGYSEVPDDEDPGYDPVPVEFEDRLDPEEPDRKPFLLVGSALTSIFVVGVVALVISLAVSIRPTVDQRPNPGESVIVPSSQAPATPEAQVPAPAPAPSTAETIQEPIPVVQQAPRTVFVNPAPKAPAPAAPVPEPAAPAPVPEAPAPAPVAPAPVPVPIVIPAPVLPPPVIQLPRAILPPFLRPPTHTNPYPSQQYPSYPSAPPQYPSSPPSPPQYPSSPPSQSPPSQVPSPPSQAPSYPSAPPTTQAPSNPAPPASSSGSGGGYGSDDSGSSSSRGSGGGSGSAGSGDSSSSSGSGSSGGSGGSQSPIWTTPPGIGH